MADNRGKDFEARFLKDFSSIPSADVTRIYDTTNQFHGIKNISDFVCYLYPNMFYMEVKSCKGNTFNFAQLTQYDDLVKKLYKRGVRAGVTIWFIDFQKVVYVPIVTIKKMKENGLKSVNLKNILSGKDKYYFIDVPSEPMRVFLKSNYLILQEVPDDTVIEQINKEMEVQDA